MKEGKYIYCIAELDQLRTFDQIGIGDRGDKIHTICYKNIAAVVSNSPVIKYSVSRENTIVHSRAIERVMVEYPVLPVRFATIAESEEMVKNILEREYERFIDLLKIIKGKKELGLKAIFIEKVVYKEIMDKYEDIKLLQQKLAVLPPEKTFYERMKIGEMVESALKKEKEIYKKDILSLLSPLAVEIKLNNSYGELMILNAAFLVEEAKEPEFDQNVQEISQKYENKVKFKYVGTLPPFNFVNLVIETGEY